MDQELEYRYFAQPFAPEIIDQVDALCTVLFGPHDIDLAWRLGSMPDAGIWAAFAEGRLVGFKAGYAMTQKKFCSWLGGVLPEHRRRGVASTLMERQHQGLARSGYFTVETATNQENLAMAGVNLRHGLSICGLRTEPHRVQILFSKALGADQPPAAR